MTETVIHNPNNKGHLARIRPLGVPVRVIAGGDVVAESTNAIVVAEESPSYGALPEAIYIPKGDVRGLEAVPDKSTHCPLKGDASYLAHDGREIAWTYDRPLDGSTVLANYVAFYADRVTIETGSGA